MVEVITVAAWVLLVAGVLGSLVPAVPGALFSLAGVYAYWVATGFTAPDPVVLTVLTLLGVGALGVDWFGGPVAARLGGASTRTAVVAGIVGIGGLVLAGPVGLVLGVAGTAFGLEYYRHREAEAGVRAGLAAVVGVLASPLIQGVLTATMLVVMLVIEFL